MENYIYIGNLPFKTTEEELRQKFATVGEVLDIRMALDDGHFMGFGFVKMGSSEEVKNAIATFHNTDFGGRNAHLYFGKDFISMWDKYIEKKG